jgi:hypothetical protein
MFKRLKEKWKVNGWNLLLIISTFALGGSLCGYVGRMILTTTGIDKGLIYFLLYIILISILWPFSVLLISIPLGQYSFFKNYIKRIINKIGGKK